MVSHAPRRQIGLFLIAIILPSAVLVALGVRMIGQERELAEKRLADDRRRAVAQIRQDLLAKLETIKLEELTAPTDREAGGPSRSYVNPAVALVALIKDGQLVLPWEAGNTVQTARTQLADAAFARLIRQGQRAEFGAREFSSSIELYSRAVEAARHPTQSGYARLLLARALSSAERDREARAQYRRLLALPSGVTDEYGIPLGLYAAARLLDAKRDHQLVLDRLAGEIEPPAWLAPATAYMLRDLVSALIETAQDSAMRSEARDVLNRVLGEIHLTEQVLALQRDFPRLGLGYAAAENGTAQPRWVPFGGGEWLVSATSSLGALPEAVVAVTAPAIFASLGESEAWSTGQLGEVSVLTNGGGAGELLGARLPGLEVVFPSGGDGARGSEWGLQRSFYMIALLLVLSVTLFGAYLLWRDVRLRSQFVSSVSHELKTPLTGIRMFAETLRTKESPDSKMQAEYLDTIVGESERLTRLLNNVLDLSTIEQQQKIYRPELVSLAAVAQRASEAMHYPLAQDGFTLHVETENDLPPVSVDPDALEQAILNLLTNAMKYSGESRTIDLRLRVDDGDAVIEVTDRGVGIPVEEQGRVTEKFYRVPTPENQRIPGTGLGLTLVEHMVKAHGGDLRVRSAVGEGSTFAIHLPLEREE